MRETGHGRSGAGGGAGGPPHVEVYIAPVPIAASSGRAPDPVAPGVPRPSSHQPAHPAS